MKTIYGGELKRRVDNAGLVVAVSLLIPMGGLLVADWLRRRLGPGDDAVLMWWPLSETPIEIAAWCGLAAGLVLGGLVLARRDGRWWSLVRWPWLVMALAVLAAAAVSLDSRVLVYADRVVVDGDAGQALARGELRFADAERVEVRCAFIQRKRQSDIATLSYAVRFRDGGVAFLDEARDRSPDGALRWFDVLDRLDRASLGSIPHGAGGGGAGAPLCMRALRTELGEPRFTAARRMLGVTDADFARYYSEPHEAFRRKPDDGQ